MNLVLLGPPGAGKGTQAEYIIEKFNLSHVSAGDLLREAVKNGSELGKKAKGFMKKGLLVPNDLVIDLIKLKISDTEGKKGFALDGFPRNMEQAKTLREMLIEIMQKLHVVLYIDVSDEEIVKRLSGRRTCSSCGKPFNVNLGNIGEDCADCGGKLIQRDDDAISTVKQRLNTYKNSTEPLLTFYKNEGILKKIAGDRDIKDISSEIGKILAEY